MKLRSAASGWVRAGFLAILALGVFLLFRRAMSRSAHAFATFAYTFVGLAALPIIDEVRLLGPRANRRIPIFDMAPRDSTYERLLSPAALAWPTALVLWVLVPAVALAGGVNYAVGQWVNDVAGSLGAVVAVTVGALAGLAAWLALRTVSVWRTADNMGQWPVWVEAPRTSIGFRSMVREWRREPVYYLEPPMGRPRS